MVSATLCRDTRDHAWSTRRSLIHGSNGLRWGVSSRRWRTRPAAGNTSSRTPAAPGNEHQKPVQADSSSRRFTSNCAITYKTVLAVSWIQAIYAVGIANSRRPCRDAVCHHDAACRLFHCCPIAWSGFVELETKNQLLWVSQQSVGYRAGGFGPATLRPRTERRFTKLRYSRWQQTWYYIIFVAWTMQIGIYAKCLRVRWFLKPSLQVSQALCRERFCIVWRVQMAVQCRYAMWRCVHWWIAFWSCQYRKHKNESSRPRMSASDVLEMLLEQDTYHPRKESVQLRWGEPRSLNKVQPLALEAGTE